MSDEGMSDAPWLEHFVTSQDALGGMTFAHYRDHMDDEAMLRYRASVAENNGHDMAPVNYNSLRRIIARLDAAERERDALREALNEAAQFIEVVASADFDEIAADGGVDVGMVIQKQAATVNAPRARAALTANHSATVVEE